MRDGIMLNFKQLVDRMENIWLEKYPKYFLSLQNKIYDLIENLMYYIELQILA